MKLDWIQGLSEEDRKAAVFMLAYQKARREVQGGYRLAPTFGPEIMLRPVFKQCRTVMRWLEKEGWKITWREVHWRGYLKHCFESMAPTVPHPGQLRNMRLLRSYLSTVGDNKPKHVRSALELHNLYNRVLRPEIAKDGSWQAAIGVKNLEDTATVD